MSICTARLRNTSNALTLRMCGEQIRLQVPRKLLTVNSWITQIIRQWIPDCWSGDIKYTGPKVLRRNWPNWQLMASGRSQMLATRNWRPVSAVCRASAVNDMLVFPGSSSSSSSSS